MEKLADFAGFSWDFRGKKVKICGKIGRFRGMFTGESQNSQKNWPISRVSVQKSQILKDFQGQVLRKIGRFHGNFGGNFPKKQSVKNSQFRWISFGKFRLNRSILYRYDQRCLTFF